MMKRAYSLNINKDENIICDTHPINVLAAGKFNVKLLADENLKT